jgi:hypothetical protein
MVRLERSEQGVVRRTPIANFTARIDRDTIVDDGRRVHFRQRNTGLNRYLFHARRPPE